MKICAIVKYPPIEGGVSAYSYAACHALASQGHQVYVVTNADEVEPAYRMWFREGDLDKLEATFDNGGLVRVRSTGHWDAAGFQYIPASNPMVTKLASMAAETVREHGCSVILAYYLEPYGIAANLASAWTGCPFVVRHAGSDRFRLMSHPDLSLGYKELLRQATALINSGSEFGGLAIPDGKVEDPPFTFTTTAFSPDGPRLDLDGLIRELASAGHLDLFGSGEYRDDLPVIGVYGKVGTLKGTIDLVKAMALLRRRRADAQLVIVGGGVRWPQVRSAIEAEGMTDRVWRLPFLGPWHIPAFIRACEAVCFLERGFEIAQHGPRVGAEILACGVPLIVSREIVRKQPYRDDMVDRKNHFQVPDPTDHASLADVIEQVISDPERAAEVGRAGAGLIDRAGDIEIAAGYERILSRAAATATARPARPARPAPPAGPSSGGEVAGLLPDLEYLLASRCPATAAFAGSQLTGLAGRVFEAMKPDRRSVAMMAYEITRWCAAQADAAAPEIGDALRLEHDFLWFSTDVEGLVGRPAFPVPVRPGPALPDLPAEVAGALRPVATSYRRTESLGLDPDRYVRALGEDPAEAAARSSTGTRAVYLFHKLPQLEGRVYRVGEPIIRLLDLCTGAFTVWDITGRMGAPGGPAEVAGSVSAVLEVLRERRVIGFASASLSPAVTEA